MSNATDGMTEQGKVDLKGYHLRADEEERELRESGKWIPLVCLARKCALGEQWHLASTIDALIAKTGLMHRVAEQLVNEAIEEECEQ